MIKDNLVFFKEKKTLSVLQKFFFTQKNRRHSEQVLCFGSTIPIMGKIKKQVYGYEI
jgi:hypothetical protein